MIKPPSPLFPVLCDMATAHGMFAKCWESLEAAEKKFPFPSSNGLVDSVAWPPVKTSSMNISRRTRISFK